jgi:hypothetical protein
MFRVERRAAQRRERRLGRASSAQAWRADGAEMKSGIKLR